MTIYSLASQQCIEVTQAQYNLMGALSETGDIDKAFAMIPPISEAEKQAWINDPVFWPAVVALKHQLARAKALNEMYLKDHLLSAAAGKNYTKTQMAALNTAVRMVVPAFRPSNQGKVSIRPDEVTIEFNDGNATIPAPQPKNAIEGQPGLAIDAIKEDK